MTSHVVIVGTKLSSWGTCARRAAGAGRGGGAGSQRPHARGGPWAARRASGRRRAPRARAGARAHTYAVLRTKRLVARAPLTSTRPGEVAHRLAQREHVHEAAWGGGCWEGRGWGAGGGGAGREHVHEAAGVGGRGEGGFEGGRGRGGGGVGGGRCVSRKLRGRGWLGGPKRSPKRAPAPQRRPPQRRPPQRRPAAPPRARSRRLARAAGAEQRVHLARRGGAPHVDEHLAAGGRARRGVSVTEPDVAWPSAARHRGARAHVRGRPRLRAKACVCVRVRACARVRARTSLTPVAVG